VTAFSIWHSKTERDVHLALDKDGFGLRIPETVDVEQRQQGIFVLDEGPFRRLGPILPND
jgi:hypothetical protein